MVHKQYLLIKGKPKELSIETKDRRLYLKIQKEGGKPFVLRIPEGQKEFTDIFQEKFLTILKENGFNILEQKRGTALRGYNSVNGHRVKVYGKDLLVEIKADSEEELFQESKTVRDELKERYGIESQDKCKWICFK